MTTDNHISFRSERSRNVERHETFRRVVYLMILADCAVLLIFVVVFLRIPSSLSTLMIIFPLILVSNFIFLRWKLRLIGLPATRSEGVSSRPNVSLYGCSAIFFIGTFYGLLMILQGALPRIVLPLLLFPLWIAVYCLRVARRTSTSTSNQGKPASNLPS